MTQSGNDTALVFFCVVILFLASPVTHASDNAVSWLGYQQLCKDGLHLRCVRVGLEKIASPNMPNQQKAQIYGYIAAAYIAINQEDNAKKALARMVEMDPCRNQPPPTLPSAMNEFYQTTRREVLRQDQTPPVVTHTPLNLRQFRENGLFKATITENLKLRSSTLYYRLKPGSPYRTVALQQVSQTKFQVQLSTTIRQKARYFQYYLEAVDCATRIGKAEAGQQLPFTIIFQAKGTSGRTIGGAVLLAVGSALLVTSPLTFLSASGELERWKATNDIAKSEEIRNNIILLHGLGWGGIGLGVTLGAIGTYFVLTKPRRSPPARALSLYPNEADHATMVRIPRISHSHSTSAP